MEQWWNYTDRGKLNYWDKNIIQRRWWMKISMKHWWNGNDREN
jgi:hypothetical protein